MHHPTDMITHTTAFVTPVVEHWLECEELNGDHKHFFQLQWYFFFKKRIVGMNFTQHNK